MEINLPFDSSDQTMDLIKLAALYYNKVNVACPEIGEFKLYNQELLDSTRPLVEQNVVALNRQIISMGASLNRGKNFVSNFRSTFSEIDVHFANASFVVESFAIHIHGKDAFDEMAIYLESSPRAALLLILSFTHALVQTDLLYELAAKNINFITSSNFLQSLQQNGQQANTDPHDFITTLDATPILLPDFSNLEYEDILEMRLKASDELQQMRYYINTLALKYSPDDRNQTNAKSLIEGEIKQSIKEFQAKVFGLRSKTILQALKGAANPLSYAPMLTTFFTDIPAMISLGVSMGIVSAATGLEYARQKKEIKTDPLYFTVKLKKYNKPSKKDKP